MDKATLLEGIQYVIDHAVSVSRPAIKDQVVPSAKEAGVTINDIFSICLEHSEEYLTYGIKFGARVRTPNGSTSKKHYRLQISTSEASAWNTIIFEYTQLKHITSVSTGFNAVRAVQNSI